MKKLAIWQHLCYTVGITEEKGDTMMEEELRQLLKEHGWNLFKRKRREKEYLYAQKWMQGERYLAPTTKLEQLTKEQVLEKLAKTK
jgi:hypothetical protein